MEGWIKLHRKITESAVFDNAEMLKLWVWCLIKASHQQRKIMVGTTEIKLLPGQFITGRNSAAEELKAKPITVYKRLKILKKLKMINIESNNKYSLITIEKWGNYQIELDEDEHQTEQQRNNKGTSKEHQNNTNKNDKKNKNDNNDYSLYDSEPEYGWVPGKVEARNRLAAMRARRDEVNARTRNGELL